MDFNDIDKLKSKKDKVIFNVGSSLSNMSDQARYEYFQKARQVLGNDESLILEVFAHENKSEEELIGLYKNAK